MIKSTREQIVQALILLDKLKKALHKVIEVLDKIAPELD